MLYMNMQISAGTQYDENTELTCIIARSHHNVELDVL
jgi:hypothetical protein